MMEDSDSIGVLGRISVRMSVAAFLGVAVLLILVAYGLLPEQRQTIIFSASLIGGAATVYSAFYAASSLRIQVKHTKQARAFEMLGHLNEHQTAKLRVFIEKNIDSKSASADQVYRKVVDDPECLAIVSTILGLYEDMAIAVQEGFADEVVLHRSTSYLIPWTFSRLRPYIEEERLQSKDSRLYDEMERLVSAWNSGKYLSTGREFSRK